MGVYCRSAQGLRLFRALRAHCVWLFHFTQRGARFYAACMCMANNDCTPLEWRNLCISISFSVPARNATSHRADRFCARTGKVYNSSGNYLYNARFRLDNDCLKWKLQFRLSATSRARSSLSLSLAHFVAPFCLQPTHWMTHSSKATITNALQPAWTRKRRLKQSKLETKIQQTR